MPVAALDDKVFQLTPHLILAVTGEDGMLRTAHKIVDIAAGLLVIVLGTLEEVRGLYIVHIYNMPSLTSVTDKRQGLGHRIDGDSELTQFFHRDERAGIEVVDAIPDREHKALGRIAADDIVLDAKRLGLGGVVGEVRKDIAVLAVHTQLVLLLTVPAALGVGVRAHILSLLGEGDIIVEWLVKGVVHQVDGLVHTR